MVRAKKTIASVLCNTGIRVTAAWLGCFLPPLILCEASGLDFPKQLTAAALVFFLIALYRVIFIEKHPLIKQFGSAIALAGCIRAGGTFAIWHTPPYRKHQLIITEEYIVCPEKVQSYLGLETITTVQRCMLHGAGYLRVLFGTRSFSAAKALGVSGKDRRYHKQHPLPETEQFDLLCLWDIKKRRHLYYVAAADFHDVLAFLREYLPEAQIKPERSI